jgi:hypothetical protein
MGQNLYDLIKGGNLIAYADDDLRRQISHAVAVESSRGWKIAKDKASLKIDAVVALAIAALAAVDGQAAGDERFLPSMALWDACREDLPPLTAEKPIVIALAADVAKDSSFGLVGVTAHPTRPGVLAARLVHEWKPKDGIIDHYGNAETPGPDFLIRNVIMPRYRVLQVVYNPDQLRSLCSRLVTDSVVWCQPIDQADRWEAGKGLYDAILARRIVHDGNAALRRHLDNSIRRVEPDLHKLRLERRAGQGANDLAVCLSSALLTCWRLGLGQ